MSASPSFLNSVMAMNILVLLAKDQRLQRLIPDADHCLLLDGESRLIKNKIGGFDSLDTRASDRLVQLSGNSPVIRLVIPLYPSLVDKLSGGLHEALSRSVVYLESLLGTTRISAAFVVGLDTCSRRTASFDILHQIETLAPLPKAQIIALANKYHCLLGASANTWMPQIVGSTEELEDAVVLLTLSLLSEQDGVVSDGAAAQDDIKCGKVIRTVGCFAAVKGNSVAASAGAAAWLEGLISGMCSSTPDATIDVVAKQAGDCFEKVIGKVLKDNEVKEFPLVDGWHSGEKDLPDEAYETLFKKLSSMRQAVASAIEESRFVESGESFHESIRENVFDGIADSVKRLTEQLWGLQPVARLMEEVSILALDMYRKTMREWQALLAGASPLWPENTLDAKGLSERIKSVLAIRPVLSRWLSKAAMAGAIIGLAMPALVLLALNHFNLHVFSDIHLKEGLIGSASFMLSGVVVALVMAYRSYVAAYKQWKSQYDKTVADIRTTAETWRNLFVGPYDEWKKAKQIFIKMRAAIMLYHKARRGNGVTLALCSELQMMRTVMDQKWRDYVDNTKGPIFPTISVSTSSDEVLERWKEQVCDNRMKGLAEGSSASHSWFGVDVVLVKVMKEELTSAEAFALISKSLSAEGALRSSGKHYEDAAWDTAYGQRATVWSPPDTVDFDIYYGLTSNQFGKCDQFDKGQSIRLAVIGSTSDPNKKPALENKGFTVIDRGRDTFGYIWMDKWLPLKTWCKLFEGMKWS